MQLRDDKAHAFAMTFKDRPLEHWGIGFRAIGKQPTLCRSKQK